MLHRTEAFEDDVGCRSWRRTRYRRVKFTSRMAIHASLEENLA